MLGNATMGWGASDPTDMATIFEGNACDPSHQMGDRNSASGCEMRRYLHNNCNKF
jgi:hypothetical protein